MDNLLNLPEYTLSIKNSKREKKAVGHVQESQTGLLYVFDLSLEPKQVHIDEFVVKHLINPTPQN